jgi:hypothetical protein
MILDKLVDDLEVFQIAEDKLGSEFEDPLSIIIQANTYSCNIELMSTSLWASEDDSRECNDNGDYECTEFEAALQVLETHGKHVLALVDKVKKIRNGNDEDDNMHANTDSKPAMTIYKYKLDTNRITNVSVPKGNTSVRILEVGIDRKGNLCVWVLCPAKSSTASIVHTTLAIGVYGTGKDVTEIATWPYIGSVQQGQYTWHAFVDPECTRA